MPGLDGGYGLPGDPGYPRELLLGQTASLPGQPQPRSVRRGYFRRGAACLAASLRHAPDLPPYRLVPSITRMDALYDPGT